MSNQNLGDGGLEDGIGTSFKTGISDDPDDLREREEVIFFRILQLVNKKRFLALIIEKQ